MYAVVIWIQLKKSRPSFNRQAAGKPEKSVGNIWSAWDQLYNFKIPLQSPVIKITVIFRKMKPKQKDRANGKTSNLANLFNLSRSHILWDLFPIYNQLLTVFQVIWSHNLLVSAHNNTAQVHFSWFYFDLMQPCNQFIIYYFCSNP